MKAQGYDNVKVLLADYPRLKINEFSKQYVRDLMLEQEHTLTDEQVMECAYRYICVYERLTNRTFKFPNLDLPPQPSLVSSLVHHKLIKGCAVFLLAGSNSDKDHLIKLHTALTDYNIPTFTRICSAHKQCSTLESLVDIKPFIRAFTTGWMCGRNGCVIWRCVFPFCVSCGFLSP